MSIIGQKKELPERKIGETKSKRCIPRGGITDEIYH